MNVTPATQKLLVILVVLALIGYVAYTTFVSEIPSEELTSGLTEDVIGERVGQDILILSDQLQAINIDSSVFSSPLFTSLVDISQPITPEPQGRPNPFAQIGNDSVQQASTPITTTGPGRTR